ncbi:MAG: hypothetical protein M1831_007383 [Alyxoria varia]|nr:MAG: hypothetical protein M1831_007383 [Alyxoria varia]
MPTSTRTSENPTLKAPPPISTAVPRRPALKIPLPPSPWGPPTSDLGVMVSEALKASPTPRRKRPDFYFACLEHPAPPPPTPVEGRLSVGSMTPPTPIPRGSSESRRVAFEAFWKDDAGNLGRTSGEEDRGA